MYVVVAVVVVIVLALLALALLMIVYRALKAAHTRPQGAPDPDSRAGAAYSHRGLEGAVLSVMGRAFRLMLRLGVRLGPMMMLTVRGRKSGVPRTNPVDLFERDGRHWLVATHDANASWVRNLRAAGEGTLARGRQRYAFTAVELPQEEAGGVLKEVLGPRLARPAAGFVLRQTMGVAPNAPLEEFTSAAALHPVFELEVGRDGQRGAARSGSLVRE